MEYGRLMGFSTTTRSTQRRERGATEPVTYVLACEHYDRPRNKGEKVGTRNTSTAKCDCKAQVRLKRTRNKEWDVTKFDEQYNHGMVTSTTRVHMKVNRNMPKGAKLLVEAFCKENLPIGKVDSILVGDILSFDDRDCYNLLRSRRNNKTLTSNDAASMQNFFKSKSIHDPYFFYVIQPDSEGMVLDSEGMVLNFLWVDGRSRMQCQ